MKKLVPKLGDRAAIKSFCENHRRSKQKQGLIEKLKSKLEARNSKTTESTDSQQKTPYRKSTRYINIGWLCANKKDNCYKHVRSGSGGGTRRKSVPRTTTCREILQLAKQLYFPNGVSKRGPLEKFEVELLDFSRARFENLDMTVQEMYDVSALTDLRFYLATTYKNIESDSELSDKDFIPATITSTEIRDSHSQQRYNLRSNFGEASGSSASELLNFNNLETEVHNYLFLNTSVTWATGNC